ncbi:MAG: HAD-IA family hydrolase [Bacteroidales bacterium]|nr:HAD-IA family hydrolase [Bacteroidales bacterium]
MIRNIILDFDGTLGDTTAVIIRTIQATIVELGLPARTDNECAAVIGLRLVETPPVLFPECNVDVDLYAATYRRLFHIFNTEDAVTLYPNVMETLEELKKRGIVLTIASSRSRSSLVEYVERLGLSSLISLVVGADDVCNGKPDPEAVIMTLGKFGFIPEEAIVVGDTEYDIRMGINAGTKTCAVTYGNGTRESLAEADWLIDDFSSLLSLTD